MFKPAATERTCVMPMIKYTEDGNHVVLVFLFMLSPNVHIKKCKNKRSDLIKTNKLVMCNYDRYFRRLHGRFVIKICCGV